MTTMIGARFGAALLGLVVATSVAPLSAQSKSASAAITAALDSLHRDPNGLQVSGSDVRSGARTVAAGEHLKGDVVVVRGPLDVYGLVDGNAVAVGGDVIVHRGGTVRGDALSVGGRARMDGGIVSGELRSLSAFTVGVPGHMSGPAATKRSLSLSIGWFLVLSALGLGLAVVGRTHLETVAETIRTEFARSFFFGVLGEVVLIPGLVLSVVGLAITIIGILLIPLAIVGYVLAAAGALALGFLAMAYVNGSTVTAHAEGSNEAPPWQAMLIGLSLYLALWLVSGALTAIPVVAVLIRIVAGLVTWVAITVGLGATLLSRGGTRAHHAPAPLPTRTQDFEWQTPTPVAGVAAARRPTPVSRPGGDKP